MKTIASKSRQLRNQKLIATSDADLQNFRSKKWALYKPLFSSTVTFPSTTGDDLTREIRHGITFTPYAFATICNANCTFCSENLERKEFQKFNSYPTRRIMNYDLYFTSLELAFKTLQSANVPIGLRPFYSLLLIFSWLFFFVVVSSFLPVRFFTLWS